MKRKGILILVVAVPLILYYVGYLILFSFNYDSKPLIYSVQKELVLDKDVAGSSISEIDRNKTYDYIFLGSSHCYRSFDPFIFESHGYSAYNLGSSSQAPVISYHLLKKHIDQAKTFIVEVYPVALQLKGTESFMSLNASLSGAYDLLGPILLDMRDARCLNALTIKPFIDHYNLEKPYNISHHLRGYVETRDTVPVSVNYSEEKVDSSSLVSNLKYLDKMINYCRLHGKKIIFVYAPVPDKLKIEREEFAMKQIERLSDSTNTPFINFGRAHHLKSNEHFFDDDHMNAAGVRYFNEELIKRLVK